MQDAQNDRSLIGRSFSYSKINIYECRSFNICCLFSGSLRKHPKSKYKIFSINLLCLLLLMVGTNLMYQDDLCFDLWAQASNQISCFLVNLNLLLRAVLTHLTLCHIVTPFIFLLQTVHLRTDVTRGANADSAELQAQPKDQHHFHLQGVTHLIHGVEYRRGQDVGAEKLCHQAHCSFLDYFTSPSVHYYTVCIAA